jgi:hypothetical protein
MSDTMQTLDKSIAAAGGAADFDIEHHVLIATNKLIARGFLQLPEGFIDPEQQATNVSFIMATASRFVCEPWRWVGHLYLPFLTAVGVEDNVVEQYSVLHDDTTLLACIRRLCSAVRSFCLDAPAKLAVEVCRGLYRGLVHVASLTWLADMLQGCTWRLYILVKRSAVSSHIAGGPSPVVCTAPPCRLG